MTFAEYKNQSIPKKVLLMPLPMKTLQEASQLLGLPEAEIKAMAQMGKIRAVMKNGVPRFAPDELARMARSRKTLPESAKK